jgi:hypothetical protein
LTPRFTFYFFNLKRNVCTFTLICLNLSPNFKIKFQQMLDKGMGLLYPKNPEETLGSAAARAAPWLHDRPRIGAININPCELERQPWRSPRRLSLA